MGVLCVSSFMYCTVLATLASARLVDQYSYINYSWIDAVPFGSYSHFLPPWRAYINTRPVSHLLNGVGLVFGGNLHGTTNFSGSARLLAKHMARQGIRNVRFEVDWGHFNYYNESQVLNPDEWEAKLQGLSRAGIRPVLLLNGNSGAPIPNIGTRATVSSNAAKGARSICFSFKTEAHQWESPARLLVAVTRQTSGATLTGTRVSTSGWHEPFELRANYSGFQQPAYSGGDMCHTFFTGLHNDSAGSSDGFVPSASDGPGPSVCADLSRPLLAAIQAGAELQLNTMLYRPFAPPGTPEGKETLLGWSKYAGSVASFARRVMGPLADTVGFDLEMWNELTFGSDTLQINKYYDPPLYPEARDSDVWVAMRNATAHAALSNAGDFSGVRITDGIGNTVPWPASTEEPDRFRAISKHPYHTGRTYPEPSPGQKGHPVNALGRDDSLSSNGYRYTAVMPEYSGHYLYTESLLRDAGPYNNSINGAIHGSIARRASNGTVIECPVWITEVNSLPTQVFGPNVTVEKALVWKQKMALRYFAFYLHKGVEKLCMFDATSGDTSFGMVLDEFVQWAVAHPEAPYPSNDSSMTSPALRSVKLLLDAAAGSSGGTTAVGSDSLASSPPSPTPPLVVNVSRVTDDHDTVMVHGHSSESGGPPDDAHPDILARDAVAILPYYSGPSRLAVLAYVVTRDARHWPIVPQGGDPEDVVVRGISSWAHSSQGPCEDGMGQGPSKGYIYYRCHEPSSAPVLPFNVSMTVYAAAGQSIRCPQDGAPALFDPVSNSSSRVAELRCALGHAAETGGGPTMQLALELELIDYPRVLELVL